MTDSFPRNTSTEAFLSGTFRLKKYCYTISRPETFRPIYFVHIFRPRHFIPRRIVPRHVVSRQVLLRHFVPRHFDQDIPFRDISPLYKGIQDISTKNISPETYRLRHFVPRCFEPRHDVRRRFEPRNFEQHIFPSDIKYRILSTIHLVPPSE